ncbi:hypothetical protein [Hyphomicrobium sp. LHD-15]|uniref:hypothetical protein n=1 Tax=Hyphomicrobium sp. LHD-15 TaxID=3072142 RepID=UPI00280C4D0D|nr:hypothetical protein [Hyphomicrobium sp. LHD-15]MDQ8697216.1 hypothetical protein [Hyphomicrobium sp. LHD-15]
MTHHSKKEHRTNGTMTYYFGQGRTRVGSHLVAGLVVILSLLVLSSVRAADDRGSDNEQNLQQRLDDLYPSTPLKEIGQEPSYECEARGTDTKHANTKRRKKQDACKKR